MIKKHIIKILLFVSLCLLFVNEDNYSQKQRIRFDRLSIEEGLTQSSVIIIKQDNQGFLWFGTYVGLIRYDGYHFKTFLNSPDDSSSLAQNSVRSILIDSKGVMWVGTENGLSKYNSQTENFVNYYHNPSKLESLSNNRIRDVIEDKNGIIWVATEDGLNKFDRDNELFERYLHNPNNPNSIIDNFIRKILEDSSGRLWLGTNLGLDLFDRKTGKFYHFKHNPYNINSLSDDKITAISEDKNGVVWIGTRDGGINKLDPGTDKFIRYTSRPNNPKGLSHNYVRDILTDKDGEMWIGTFGGGLDKYNRNTDVFINYKYNQNDLHSLSSNSIYSIFEDRAGLIWIGTDFGGISIINKRKNQFYYVGNVPHDNNSLNNNNVHAFYEDPQDKGKTIWIGTLGGGLTLFNRVNGTFISYMHNPNNQNSISNNSVRSIYKDKFGYLWVGTDNGLNKFDLNKKTFKRYFPSQGDPFSLRHFLIKTIYEDKSGTLWIGTNGGGLSRYDRKNDRFINYLPDENDPNSISDNIVWSIYEDSKNNLWIGTNSGGLNLFNRETEKFTVFKRDAENPKSISIDKVLNIYEDQMNRLWIGTAGGGLNSFEVESNTFKHYGLNQERLPNTIHSIIDDDNGYLWISSTTGLVQFDPVKNRVVTFNLQDGLQSNEFHVNSSCKSITGELFFGGINGLNIFFPKNIKEDEYTPQIVITDFLIFNRSVPILENANGKKVLTKSISVADQIVLSYSDEVITFEFAALDFSAPNKNMYAYIMEGFEKDWNYVGNRRFATYTKLPSGNYTFKVKGSNHNGVWSNELASIEIVITPPLWGAWWFRIILFVLVFSGVLALYKARTARIRAYNKELEKRVTERTIQLEEAIKELEAFSYSVSHDLRAPLRAIDGYNEIFIEDYGPLIDDEGKRLLNVISQSSLKMNNLINDLLTFSKAGRIELKHIQIDMKGLVDSVINELIDTTSRDNYTIKINLYENIVGDETLIRQVWINLISNALKFSSKAKYPQIQIGMSITEQEIIYFVADNGAGFNKEYAHKLFKVFQRLHKDEEYEGTGVGLAIVQRIILRHGGKVWAEGEVGKGARFYFSLPRKEL